MTTKIGKNQAVILEEIQGLIVPHCAKKMEKKKCKFKVKLNDYWMNLHKN
jgi:hypothetical protein